jgi:hypothetical protein
MVTRAQQTNKNAVQTKERHGMNPSNAESQQHTGWHLPQLLT